MYLIYYFLFLKGFMIEHILRIFDYSFCFLLDQSLADCQRLSRGWFASVCPSVHLGLEEGESAMTESRNAAPRKV